MTFFCVPDIAHYPFPVPTSSLLTYKPNPCKSFYSSLQCKHKKKNPPTNRLSKSPAKAESMTRRCSHCSNNGHNSRTCPTRCGSSSSGGVVKLFGVRLNDGSFIKKSASMGNLSSSAIKKSASLGNLSSAHYHSSSSAAASPNQTSPSAPDPAPDPIHIPDGYLSDDPTHASKRRADRKKGTPWTEEEHRLFLLGLQKLGKGDWRGISRNFVLSRTPTQVASHAQKHFIRQCSATRRKRRSSLFDMAPDMATDPPLLPEDQFMLPPQAEETDKTKSPPLSLSLKPDSESMDATPSDMIEDTKDVSTPLVDLPPTIPMFYPAYLPLPYPFWPLNSSPIEQGAQKSQHLVHKPIPIFPKEPVNVDELVGMSQLSLKESVHDIEPSRLSLKLPGEHSRQSAFHARVPVRGSEVNKGAGNGNPDH